MPYQGAITLNGVAYYLKCCDIIRYFKDLYKVNFVLLVKLFTMVILYPTSRQ